MSDPAPDATVSHWRTTSQQREVYFIQAQTLRFVKIGVADNAAKRMRDLRMSSPDALRVLGVIICRRAGATETELHAKFARHRLHGEWFRPVDEILLYAETFGFNRARMDRLQRELDEPTRRRGRKPKANPW